jgi:hypothetical protein
MDRRKVLKNIGSGIGAITLTPSVVCIFQSCQTEVSYTPVFISKDDFEMLSNIMELIIPQTEIPGAKELKLPEFLDSYVNAVFSSKRKLEFEEGFAAFKIRAIELSEKEKVSQLSIKNLDAQLTKYLRFKGALPKEEQLAAKFANELRDLTVNAFKTNEFIGENVLAYSPIPGDYRGCVDLMETTGGKAWSL